jgi:hypothetical protein
MGFHGNDCIVQQSSRLDGGNDRQVHAREHEAMTRIMSCILMPFSSMRLNKDIHFVALF